MDLDFNIDLSDITDINIDLDVMLNDLVQILKDFTDDFDPALYVKEKEEEDVDSKNDYEDNEEEWIVKFIIIK